MATYDFDRLIEEQLFDDLYERPNYFMFGADGEPDYFGPLLYMDELRWVRP